MNAKTNIPHLDKLLDTIDEGKIVEVLDKGHTVKVVWPDGSSAYLFLSGERKDDWRFGNDNVAYQAGYAYACGYYD